MHSESMEKKWLWLGIIALAIAGVFALVLVVARTPQLKEIVLAQQLFSVALVIHVDLSVLVWFLSMIGMGLSAYIARAGGAPIAYLQPTAFWSMAAGTALMALSPLDGEWEVIKSNYIPVLYNVMFFLGLSLMAASMLILSMGVLMAKREVTAEGFCWRIMAWILLLALAMFAANGALMPEEIPHKDRYEFLFWSGGHTLQFAYCLMAIFAWAALYKARTGEEGVASPFYLLAGLTSVAGVLMPLYAYSHFAVDSPEFQRAFTQAMIYLGGVAPTVIGALLLFKLLRAPSRTPDSRAASSALWMSLLVFGMGGLLGLMIQGQNVTIPAHYHGSIVGVTLALMGYAYTQLPRLGYRNVLHLRTAFWQPIILGIGQVMHIGGLAYSGGYGVLRKQAVGNTSFPPDIQAALGFMGLGGLLAIIGGLMFVVVMVRALRQPIVTHHVS